MTSTNRSETSWGLSGALTVFYMFRETSPIIGFKLTPPSAGPPIIKSKVVRKSGQDLGNLAKCRSGFGQVWGRKPHLVFRLFRTAFITSKHLVRTVRTMVI